MESKPPQSQSLSPPSPPLQGDQAKTDHSSVANNQLQIVTVPPANEEKENKYDYRFQRTDQWMPVYSWLESLDTNEPVRPDEILEWLTANPNIREHLSSKHSIYHLKHYIKKCHQKILKKRNKNKVNKSVKRRKENTGTRLPSTGIPKDPEMLKTEHKEAFEKYNVLIEFENRLMAQMLPTL